MGSDATPGANAAKKRARAALLLALLGAFAVGKASFDPGLGERSADGNYYYQIARHVNEGDGLRTSVSLYFQGFKEFPHRVNQNPMWPLLLGYTSRLGGLPATALALPEILYLVDLLLLFLLANRLWLRVAGASNGLVFRRDGIVRFGHVAVLLFGANHVFFRFSSLPYTEPLAFGFAFATLICVDRAAIERSGRWAGAAGLLAGLAFLTRAQMVPLLIAVPLALALAGSEARRRLLVPVAIGIAATLAPWILYLSTWVEQLTPTVVMGLATLRETPELLRFDPSVKAESPWGYVLDRAGGLLVAFSPIHRYSYVSSFHAGAYLAPLGLGVFVVDLVRRRFSPGDALGAERALVAATLLCGVGMLLPVHLSHAWFFKEWLFAHRHGLPLILLILPALAYLDAHRAAAVRVATTVLLVVALVGGLFQLRQLMKTEFPRGLDEHEWELVAWLDAQRPRPIVVTREAQRYSVFSRVYYHWMVCAIGSEQTRRMLRDTGADYLIVLPKDIGCDYIKGLRDELRVVAAFGDEFPYLTVLAAPEEGRGRAP